MKRRPPRSTRTDTLFPYTTLFRSLRLVHPGGRRDDPLRLSAADRGRPAAGDGARVRLAVLRSGARRRPAAVAAPVLGVRPPGGLHHLPARHRGGGRSEEHTSELQSLMRISYAVFCLKKKQKETEKSI